MTQAVEWKELDFGDCELPSLEYTIEDAKYRFAGLGPISLEVPTCSMKAEFGPPEEEVLLQVFDEEFLSTFSDRHNELLQQAAASVMEFRSAMESLRSV